MFSPVVSSQSRTLDTCRPSLTSSMIPSLLPIDKKLFQHFDDVLSAQLKYCLIGRPISIRVFECKLSFPDTTDVVDSTRSWLIVFHWCTEVSCSSSSASS